MARTTTLEGRDLQWAVWTPPFWSAQKSWPVILFLHGSAERGSDGVKQTQAGLGPALLLHPERWPAVVVLPQCPADLWWGDPVCERFAMEALQAGAREFSGDPARFLLTGKSMGGNGVWRLAADHPGTFAAIAPVCGFIRFDGAPPPKSYPGRGEPAEGEPHEDYAGVARAIGDVPVWMFHGANDRAVPVEESRMMERALKAAGRTVRYTEYPDGDHQIWDRAYADPELAPWMISRRKSS